MAIKLLVGLRNPGSAYEATRHNAGDWFVSAYAKRHKGVFQDNKKFHGELATLTIDGHQCHVLLPNTFMNHSGLSVRTVTQFYKILPEEMVVVHDDLDLPPGRIRLKTGGGHGGHNGLRDLMTQLGSGDFHRLRIGIGHPGVRDLVLDYVLGRPSKEDHDVIMHAIDRACEVMPMILKGALANAMTRLNQ